MADLDQIPAQASFRKLFLVSTVLLVAAAAVASFLMLRAFVANLTPEIELKAGMVGRSVAGQVNHALDLGIDGCEFWICRAVDLALFRTRVGVDRHQIIPERSPVP